MLRAGGQAQSSSDNQVVNEAAKRRRLKPAAESKTAVPAILALLGVLGALAWWRRKTNKGSKRKAGKDPAPKARQSSFTFPAGASSSSENLPRNKVYNNKKNKDRKKHERERRAEKRQQGGGLSGPSDPHHENEKDNTIILTSKFVDSTPTSVSNLPKAQRMGRPGGGGSSIDPAMAEVLSRKS